MYQMRGPQDCLGAPAACEVPEPDKVCYPSFACVLEDDKREFYLNKLLARGRVTFGRASSHNIVLGGLDRHVSRHHGTIQIDEDGNLVYTDTSTKGSIVANSYNFEEINGETRILVPRVPSSEDARAYIMFGELSGAKLNHSFSLKGAARVPDELLGKKTPHYRLELILEKNPDFI
jgi:hypothetical protein